MNTAIVYRGFKRETEVEVIVTEICPEMGVGQIDCIECEGDGWWGYGPTENECGPCVECKGSGRVLVNC